MTNRCGWILKLVIRISSLVISRSPRSPKFLRRQLRQRLGRGADDFRLAEQLRGAGAVQMRLDHLRIKIERAFGAHARLHMPAKLAVHARKIRPAALATSSEF